MKGDGGISINEWFSEKLGDTEYLKKLKREFVGADPFPFLVIKNFLPQKKAEELLLSLQHETFSEKRSDLFHFFQTQDLAASKNSTIKSFRSFLNSSKFHSVTKAITGLSTNKSVDLFGSVYSSGNYLLCHDDRLAGRRIAFMYYLTHNFSKKDGGTLNLLEDSNGIPGKVAQSLVPSWNTFVLFKVSRKSWHEVDEVLSDKQRLAIGGWLH